MLRPTGSPGIFQTLTLSVLPASTPGICPSAESFQVLSSTLLTVEPLLAFVVSVADNCLWSVGQTSDVCPLLCCIQGQGALSERLRSFSMQDLTTIRGDGTPAPSSPPPPGSGRASGKHGQPKMSRSASESAGSSGRCHFTFPPFQFPGLAFAESGPVYHMACQPGVALNTDVHQITPGQLRSRAPLRPRWEAWPGDSDQGQD